MNFWKRLGAGLITFALVLGLLPAVTIAVPTATVDAPKTGAKILYAGFRLNDAKLDGVLDEEEWSLSGKMSDGSKHYRFGMLYSTATLYMAYEVPAGNPSITVKIDGVNVRTSPVVNAKTGCAELAISLSDAGIRLSGFDASVPLSIKLGNMSWDGAVTFTSLRPDTITDDLSGISWSANGAEMNYANNALHMYTTTYAGGSGGTSCIISRFSGVSDEMHTIVQSIDSNNVSLDFDCQINEMPAYTTHYAFSDYYTNVVNGLVLTWTGKRYTDIYT